MASRKTRKKGEKGKKIGRNRKKCERYLISRRRIQNKTRKMLKRIKNFEKETRERIIKLNPIKRRKEKEKEVIRDVGL